MKFLKKSTTSGHKQILENITLSTSDTVVTYFLRGERIFLLVIMGLKILKLSGMSHKIVEMHDYSFLPFKCQIFKSFFFLCAFSQGHDRQRNIQETNHSWYPNLLVQICTIVPILDMNPLPAAVVTKTIPVE